MITGLKRLLRRLAQRKAIRARIRANIDTHGWHVLFVPDGAPAFAYSIGFQPTLRAPEIIVVGLPQQVSHRLINDIGKRIRDGLEIEDGGVYSDFIPRYRCTFRLVPKRHYGNYLGTATRFYSRDDFPVLQLIYPDREGRWPWEEGVSPEFQRIQPVLADSEDPDWAR